jgi:predicted transcriptional regulator of viral defense system
MNFIKFKENYFNQGIFTSYQVYSRQSDFDRNNFSRWIKKGLITRLRRGVYSFPEYKSKPNFNFFVANRIYRPSYISLHSALSFYGLIPESIFQATSVTTLKTEKFENDFGMFVYRTIGEKMMFGYIAKKLDDEKHFLMASPEKAIVDLLYLYPEYDSEKEILELRLDDDLMGEIVNKDLLLSYSEKTKINALIHRVQYLIAAYKL